MTHNEDNKYSVGAALWWGTKSLKEAGIETASLDAEILLGLAANLTKEQIYFDADAEIEEKIYFNYERLIALRKERIPVAYLSGKKEFFGLKIEVDENVLIPRPETEDLVEAVLEAIKKFNGKKCNLLEVGTGSGAIAIAIAHSLKNWREKYQFDDSRIKIVATDISQAALAVAQENANTLGVADKIVLVKSDLLTNTNAPIDILVANLPYLCRDKRDLYSPEINYEPAQALFADDNGCDLYVKLFQQIKKLKKQPQAVIVECEEEQVNRLKKIYPKAIFITV